MKTNNTHTDFSEQLRQRLAQAETAPPEGLWDDIERLLEAGGQPTVVATGEKAAAGQAPLAAGRSLPASKVRHIPLRRWAAAAAVLLIVGLAATLTLGTFSPDAPLGISSPETPLVSEAPLGTPSPDAPLVSEAPLGSPSTVSVGSPSVPVTVSVGSPSAPVPSAPTSPGSPSTAPVGSPSAPSTVSVGSPDGFPSASATVSVGSPDGSPVAPAPVAPASTPSPDASTPSPDASTPSAPPPLWRHTISPSSPVALALYASNTLGSQQQFGNVRMSDAMSAKYFLDTENSSAKADPIFLYDYSEEEHHSQPLSFGISVSYPLNGRIALSTGLTYTRLRSDFIKHLAGSDIETRQCLHYVGIPLAVTCRLYEQAAFQVYASAGVEADWNVQASLTTQGQPGDIQRDKIQLAGKATVGLQYGLTPQVALYAEPGAVYYPDNGSPLSNYFKEHPFALSLQAGLRWTIGSR